MTKKSKKHKRGERGSVEEQSTPKRPNMADNEEEGNVYSSTFTSLNGVEQPSPSQLKEILIDIQINVNNILRDNIQLRQELTDLKSLLLENQRELNELKPMVTSLQQELDEARNTLNEQEEEISELYDLQDSLEQYTRKNSLEFLGLPERAYASTEEAVLKIAEALDVNISSEDVEISHHLKGEPGKRPVIAKFNSHKKKSEIYKARSKLKHVALSDIFPEVSDELNNMVKGIFINENLTSYRKDLMKEAIKKRKSGQISSAWTLDGKIFIKTTPTSRPIRIYEKHDLEDI